MVTAWRNGFGKEAGETPGHSPVSLPSSTAWSAALGGVRSPSSLLSFVLHQGLCSCSCGHLGGPGLPVLWRERWAQPMGQDENSWVDVRSFLFLSFDQAGAWGSTSACRLWKPKQEHDWKQAFFSDLFCPSDGDVYRQTKQSCSFLRGHPGKRDMCATIYHETPHTRDTWDTALKGCICPL